MIISLQLEVGESKHPALSLWSLKIGQSTTHRIAFWRGGTVRPNG